LRLKFIKFSAAPDTHLSTIRRTMLNENLLSGAFCLAAVTLMASVISSTRPLTAQSPGDVYTTVACGEYNGKLCKTVEIKSCVGSSCTVETTYYYYSTSIE
jgi:hypothetical protein